MHHDVTLGGVIVELRERPLRSGNGRMAFVTIEDLQGQVEAIVFSRAYEEAEEALKSGDPLLLHGNVRLEGDEESKQLKVRVSKAVRLSDVRRERTNKVKLIVDSARVTTADVSAMADVLRAHPGECEVLLKVIVPGEGFAVIRADETIRTDPTEQLVEALQRLLGPEAVLMGA